MNVDSLAWYVARASGITAWLLLCTDVFLGLMMSTKVAGKRPRPNWLLRLHRFTGGVSVTFVAVHIAGLMADHYVPFGWRQVFIPLASHYRPLPVAVGVVAMYVLVAIQATSLAMRWLPRRWWRAVHSTSFLLFGLASVHVFTAGTDAVNRALRATGLGLASLFVFLMVYRWLRPVPERRIPERRGSSVTMAEVAP